MTEGDIQALKFEVMGIAFHVGAFITHPNFLKEEPHGPLQSAVKELHAAGLIFLHGRSQSDGHQHQWMLTENARQSFQQGRIH